MVTTLVVIDGQRVVILTGSTLIVDCAERACVVEDRAAVDVARVTRRCVSAIEVEARELGEPREPTSSELIRAADGGIKDGECDRRADKCSDKELEDGELHIVGRVATMGSELLMKFLAAVPWFVKEVFIPTNFIALPAKAEYDVSR